MSWRAILVLGLALAAGCSKTRPEDDFQMAPLPQYEPRTAAPAASGPPAPLPSYEPPPTLGLPPPVSPQAADAGAAAAPPAPAAPKSK